MQEAGAAGVYMQEEVRPAGGGLLPHTCWFVTLLVLLCPGNLQVVTAEFHCPEGWHVNHDMCYYVSEDKVTWHQAGDMCKGMNASLVIIKNTAENTFIDSVVSSAVWIGLHDYNEDDHFTWMDNTDVNFTMWASGEPNNAGENCVSVYAHYNKGSWNDIVCRKLNKFICQRHLNLSGGCDIGWHNMMGSCILFSKSTATWVNARTQCRALGGDLVVLKTQNETDFITNNMPWSDFWIGLSDRATEGVFAWLDDTAGATFFNWHSGEPNNGNNGLEDCVNMITGYRKGQWATDGCLEHYWYACEAPQVQSTNTTNSSACDVGWTAHNESCYHVSQHLVTWYEGRHACRRLGADLVVIESEQEQIFLKNHPNFTSQNVWIGLNDLAEREKWSWLDSTEEVSTYTNWARTEPSTSSPRSDCVMLHVTSVNMGRWEPARCHRTLSYICEADSLGYCESGWTLYNGHCYRVNTMQVTWLQAEMLCENTTSNGHLVSIGDQEEQRYIEGQLQEHRGMKGFWIGLNSRRKVNDFVWPDHQQLSWSNWDVRQPKNVTDEKCVERMGIGMSKGQWNDQNCMDEKAFVCQRPADGQQTFFDFAFNNSIYKIVWHQLPQPEGHDFCRRHLGSNASMWSVGSHDELESVGAQLTHRVRGTSLQFWVSGDPTVNGTFVYTGSTPLRPEPGRRCLMVSQERQYQTDWGYRARYMTPTPNPAAKYIMTPRPCCEEKMVICEKTIEGEDAGFQDPLGRSLYRLVSGRALPYWDAVTACRDLLGDDAGLAVVESHDEQLTLSGELKARHRGGTVEYWLGGRPGAEQDHGLLRGPGRPGDDCEVLYHEDISEVAWDKVIFDIIPSSCQGAKHFICELKLTTYVEAGSSSTPDAVSKDASSSLAPSAGAASNIPSGIRMTLENAGCTGPCIGLAVAYPFTIVATILLTLFFIWFCKRKRPPKYHSIQSSVIELRRVENGKHSAPQQADSLTILTQDQDPVS